MKPPDTKISLALSLACRPHKSASALAKALREVAKRILQDGDDQGELDGGSWRVRIGS